MDLTVPSTALATLALVSSLALAPPNHGSVDESERAIAGPCGFHMTPEWNSNGSTSAYKHCAETFILIRIHWTGGASNTVCVKPWQRYRFGHHTDGQYVHNAYYVPIPPRLDHINGKTYCAIGQPQH